MFFIITDNIQLFQLAHYCGALGTDLISILKKAQGVLELLSCPLEKK
jgi:hypothetical protein